MDEFDVTIIGAGIIGLSIAAKLANNKNNLVVLERNDSFGQETSSRNSEVIHAGIYYPKDSLKAKMCVEGNHMLYDLCRKYKISHKKLGKLIIANTSSEINQLEDLYENAKGNGVSDINLIDKKEIKELEPNIKAEKALYSQNTGIVDSHSLMKFYANQAEGKGSLISYNVEVKNIEKINDKYKVEVIDSNGDFFSFFSKIVINCAGLESDNVAEMAGIDIEKQHYVLKYCKGQYFRVSNKRSNYIKRLIYPVPESEGGLGIHATPDLTGSLRLGPDDRYISRDEANYDLDSSDRDKFYQSAKQFLPFLEKDDLSPDMAGIRPKLQGKGEGFRDFVIKEESDLGLPGFINLIGVESPGLTCAPAIAGYVGNIVKSLNSNNCFKDSLDDKIRR